MQSDTKWKTFTKIKETKKCHLNVNNSDINKCILQLIYGQIIICIRRTDCLAISLNERCKNYALTFMIRCTTSNTAFTGVLCTLDRRENRYRSSIISPIYSMETLRKKPSAFGWIEIVRWIFSSLLPFSLFSIATCSTPRYGKNVTPIEDRSTLNQLALYLLNGFVVVFMEKHRLIE